MSSSLLLLRHEVIETVAEAIMAHDNNFLIIARNLVDLAAKLLRNIQNCATFEALLCKILVYSVFFKVV